MKRSIFLVSLGIALTFALSAQKAWEGTAVVGRYGDFPPTGYYGTSDSFPRNTLVDVLNLVTGKSVRVIVVGASDDPSLFLVLSVSAAEALGVENRDVARVRVTPAVLPGGTGSAGSFELPYSVDPEVNPAARAGDANLMVDRRLAPRPAPVPAPAASAEPVVPEEPAVPPEPAPAAAAPVVRDEPGPEFTESSVSPRAIPEPRIASPDIPPEYDAGPETAPHVSAGIAAVPESSVLIPAEPEAETETEIEYAAAAADQIEAPEPEAPEPEAPEPEAPEPEAALADAASDDDEIPEEGSGIRPEADPMASLEPAEMHPPEASVELLDSIIASIPEEPVHEEPAVAVEEPAAPVYDPPVSAAAAAADETGDEWARQNLPLVRVLASRSHYLQIASYADPRGAKPVVDSLAGAYPVVVLPGNGERPLYRVLVGPVGEDERGLVLYHLRARGFRDAFLRRSE